MKLFFEYLNSDFVNENIIIYPPKKKKKKKIKRDGEPNENSMLGIFCFLLVNKMGQVLR